MRVGEWKGFGAVSPLVGYAWDECQREVAISSQCVFKCVFDGIGKLWPICPTLIIALVITGLLYKMHRIHVRRQDDYMGVTINGHKAQKPA